MRQTVFLALQLFVAAALALALARWLDLANPYWAAMPVWVVQQAYREDLVLRAVLRIIGTLAGAALALAVVRLGLPDVLTALVLALGVGCAAALAYWIGTVMSYGAFMAGVTLFVVLLPGFSGFSAATGIDPVAAAVDRIFCTLIGVACVTAATFAFTPRRVGQAPMRAMEGRARKALLRFAYCCAMTVCAAAAVIAFPRFDILAGAMTLIVYSMILSSAPDPRPIASLLVPAVLLGVCASIAYLFLLKSAGAEARQAAVLLTAGFLLAGAFLRAWPRTASYGLDANMCFLIVSEVGAWRHGTAEVTLAGIAVVCAAAAVSVSGRLLPAERR